jgi:transcription elongation GreA/GreB family factor
MTTKQQLLQICNMRVDKRINDYKEEINLIKDSIESNDKGNSEDDDSGNGKLLNDLEKNMEHLNDAQKTKAHLQLIKTNTVFNDVVLGSIVKTNQRFFYISTSIGEINLDNETYFAISLNSPIGQLLKNKTVNEQFEFNQTKYVITEII